MANYYTAQAVANYNDDAPVDDGTESEANRAKWATVKNEIGDPLKTFAEAIDTELGNFENRMLFNGSSAQSTNYTITAANLGQRILASSAITVTALAAATATNGFVCEIINVGTGIVGLAVPSGEALNDITDGTMTLKSGEMVLLFSDGTGWRAFMQRPGPHLFAPIAVSGTSDTFTSIPGWAREITFTGVGLSSNGTSNFFLQIGPSGGVETTAYLSGVEGVDSTIGFGLTTGNVAGSIWAGRYVLTLEDVTDNTWVGSGTFYDSGSSGAMSSGAGRKSTTGLVSQLLFGPANGTDTMDAGEINILIR